MKQTNIYKFFDQVKQETSKIVWPKKNELITSVSVVIAAVSIFSLGSLVLDYGIHIGMKFLLNIGK